MQVHRKRHSQRNSRPLGRAQHEGWERGLVRNSGGADLGPSACSSEAPGSSPPPPAKSCARRRPEAVSALACFLGLLETQSSWFCGYAAVVEVDRAKLHQIIIITSSRESLLWGTPGMATRKGVCSQTAGHRVSRGTEIPAGRRPEKGRRAPGRRSRGSMRWL